MMSDDGTIGVILAGGLARRMGGGDKPMKVIRGRTLLDCVISRLGPQCDSLLLNVNGDPGRFAAFGLPIVVDSVSDYPGPLAGVLAALDWVASRRPSTKWVVSVPGDCPFLPHDLTARLHKTSGGCPCHTSRRGVGRAATSSSRTLASRPSTRSSRGASFRHPQDRGVDGGIFSGPRLLAGRACRPLF